MRYFHWTRRFKKGVPSHVWFPAKVEAWMRRRDGGDNQLVPRRTQSETALLALLDNLTRLVERLSFRPATASDWSRYSETHSYARGDFERKMAFVEKHTAARRPRLLWDLGANTGTFSRIAARHAEIVVAVDQDHEAVDLLYRETRESREQIIPLLMDIANPSPGQGWAGRERTSFVERRRPDLVLCLALVHHLRVSANVPVSLFAEWLRSLDATVIVEYVGRDDEMFAKLAANKREDYADYAPENFRSELGRYFAVEDRLALKAGTREMLLMEPKNPP